MDVTVASASRHRIEYVVGNGTLFYEFDVPGVAANLDAVAVGLLPYASLYEPEISFAGRLDRTLVRNLECASEYYEAWLGPAQAVRLRSRRTNRSTAVEWHRSIRRLGSRRGPRAVAAFSGGIDSLYQMVGHKEAIFGRRSTPISTAVLIHGFDIPLHDEEGFSAAADGARDTLGPLGVRLITVRTNWRELFAPQWTLMFGAGIASVLHHLESFGEFGFIALDQTHRTQRHPWGSNAFLNPMFSSSKFRIECFGASVSRQQKIIFLSNYVSSMKNLRVCWQQGPLSGRNCGRCEKCIRTGLGMMAAGIPPLNGLGEFSPEDISEIDVPSEVALELLEALLESPLPTKYKEALDATVARAVNKFRNDGG